MNLNVYLSPLLNHCSNDCLYVFNTLQTLQRGKENEAWQSIIQYGIVEI